MAGLRRRRLTRLGQDARGVAAIEFALIAPLVLIFVFMPMVDIGLLLYNQLRLNQAVREVAAMVMVAPADADFNALQSLQIDLLGASGQLLPGAAFVADPVVVSFECPDGSVPPDGNTPCPSGGGAASIFVAIAARYEHAPVFMPLFALTGMAAEIEATARVQIR